MIVVLGTVRLPPERFDDARSAMLRMIEGSRAEAGCLEYAYSFDVADPGLVRVTEIWHDRAALDRHFAAPHLAEWRASWGDLQIGERQLRLYECAEGTPV